MILSGYRELQRAKLLLPSPPAEQTKNAGLSAALLPKLFSDQLIREAGLTAPDTERIFRNLGLAAIALLVLALFFSEPLIAVGIPILFLFQKLSLSRRAERRSEDFERDYPALLLALSSSMKSGLDPLIALQKSRDLFREGSTMREEIERFSSLLDSGAAEDEAVNQFGSSIRHPDLDLFRAAFLLSRREGSSLAQSLQRLARVSRQRQSFRRKIRTAVALQKLSALGIGGCTILIAVIQFINNPDSMRLAFSLPIGQQLLGSALFLILCGNFWIFRLARAEV